MENATKALIIVAGALIGIMILSLAATLYFELENYVQTENDKMDANAQNAFNTQFINYISNNLKIHDVITVANLAYENNIGYNIDYASAGITPDPSKLFVAVYIDSERIDNQIANSGEMAKRLERALKNDSTYSCTSSGIIYSDITGRIYEIHFSTN